MESKALLIWFLIEVCLHWYGIVQQARTILVLDDGHDEKFAEFRDKVG